MKKTFLAVVLASISFVVFSQTLSEGWNSRTATYKNVEHNIKWQLIEDLNWTSRPIIGEDILLKVRNDDTHILVTLSANKTTPIPHDKDIWDYISTMESVIEDDQKQQAVYYSMEYVGVKVVKSQLCGIHAVKARSDMKKYYPEYNQTVHSIDITYSLYTNKQLYMISVTALSVIEEEIEIFDRIATELFNGFEIK